MRESSEWPSVGVYSGMVDHLGNFAECLRAAGPQGITGKFCMARMQIKNFPVSHLGPATYLSEGCECDVHCRYRHPLQLWQAGRCRKSSLSLKGYGLKNESENVGTLSFGR